MRGIIYTLGYYAVCGRCNKQKGLGLRDQPSVPDKYLVRDLKDEGWGESKKFGLVCPDCKGKRV